MKYALRRSISISAIAVCFATAAWSQCKNPSAPGVVLCTPTNGSTVVYLEEISVRSTPAPGASITGFSIRDKGVLIYQSPKNESGIDLIDGAIFNGSHNIVVNASDSAGNQYRAQSQFQVTGLGYDLCPVPTSPGVMICNPPAGGVYPVYTTVDATAKGKSAITKISFYLNGKFVTSQANSSGVGVAIQLSGQDIPNTLTVTATDSSGDKYSASKTLTAQYTYGQSSCFNTCTPGINIVQPPSEAYVGNTFKLNAQIQYNPEPITKMEAYIDDAIVAMSNGPQIDQQITNAPNGTHILTVKGWDTQGTEYLFQENINTNVSE